MTHRRLRILQVCTLISPNGEYGGPVRVALNQTRALVAAGHEVTLAAGARGFGDELPDQYDGIPVRLFPVRQVLPGVGFAGLASPGLWKFIRDDAHKHDILHFHLARDFVTLSAARLAQKKKLPYVVQTHGMIDSSRNPLAAPLDSAWTRPVLAAAESVLYLTDIERKGLSDVARQVLPYRELGNGVPFPAVIPNLVDSGSEVLFLARLHTRKRPLTFVRMARELTDLFPDARFTLVGPDEGEASACQNLLGHSDERISWEGPIAPELAVTRLAKCSIYVLPSVDEPFPMSVLEAMSLGKPVIVTSSCGLAPSIKAAGAGIVVDESLESLTNAVRLLLSDGVMRHEMGAKARMLAHSEFGMEKVVEGLESVYHGALKLSKEPEA